MTYQTVWGRRATSFGAQETRKYNSLFKVRPDYILPSLFISITACGTAVHCPMNSQAAMRLLHDEAGLIQWTVLVGPRNCINVQALIIFPSPEPCSEDTPHPHSTPAPEAYISCIQITVSSCTYCSGCSQSLKITQ